MKLDARRRSKVCTQQLLAASMILCVKVCLVEIKLKGCIGGERLGQGTFRGREPYNCLRWKIFTAVQGC